MIWWGKTEVVGKTKYFNSGRKDSSIFFFNISDLEIKKGNKTLIKKFLFKIKRRVLIQKATVKVAAKVGENGKIFGSVSSIQLVDTLKSLGFEIDRKNVKLSNNNIKSVGKYTADIKLHKEVSVSIDFEVAEG